MADQNEFQERINQAFGVVDAIMKGTLLPEPTEEETEKLGVADYDPELRYRVARDTLEQAYGKPKQQIEQTGETALQIILPQHAVPLVLSKSRGSWSPESATLSPYAGLAHGEVNVLAVVFAGVPEVVLT